MMVRIIGSLLLLLLMFPLQVAAVVPGDTAPDFLTEDLQGGPAITLSNYDDQVLLLFFFWTG